MSNTQDYKTQFLDNSGWRTVEIFPSKGSGATIMQKMKQAQVYYPKYRIRCVDGDGRMVDML
jgi:hypothetical protein